MNSIAYLLQVNVFLVLFYGFYLLFLKKETFNNLNRSYLVLAAITAFAVPFLQSDLVKSWFVTKQVSEVIYTSYSSEILILPATQDSPILWIDVLRILYISIVILLSTRLVINLLATNKLFSNFTNNVGNAFSFFNKIVVDETLEERDTIYRHEEVHAKHLHSADVVLFEIIAIVCWFNPIVYFYKNAVRNIHEFIADELASQNLKSKADYAILLVSQQFGVSPSMLTNSFYKASTLKLRVEMLLKSRSRKTALLKYGLIAPLFLGMMVLASATVIDKKGLETIAESVEVPLTELPTIENISILSDNISKNEKEIDGYAFSPDGHVLPGVSVIVVGTNIGTTTDGDGYYKLSNVPENAQLSFSFVGMGTKIMSIEGTERVSVHFKSSENALNELVVVGYETPARKDNSEVFTTVEQNPEFPGGVSNMYRYIGENIKYPAAAQKANVQGKVFLKFIVETDGSIGGIETLKGIGFGCDEEAIRVISQMPKWQPGIQNGKPVRVYYTMPINFRLEGGDEPPPPPRIITQSNSTTSIKVKRGLTLPFDNQLIIVDGKEIVGGIEGVVEVDNIESISVLKVETATTIYGDKGKDGVVEITTKKDGKSNSKTKIITEDTVDIISALFIVNGKEMSASEYEKIKKVGVSGYITTTITYRPEDAIKKYGEKGKNGVIVVTIKENKKP